MANVKNPVVSVPFVDRDGMLTVAAGQFLQGLANAAQAKGGPLGDDALAAPLFARGANISPSTVAWTPTLAGSTTAGAATYTTQTGLFIDIGIARLMLFTVALSAFSGAAGNAVIGGLPMPSNAGLFNQAGWVSSWAFTLTAGYTQIGLYGAPGTSTFGIIQSGSGNAPLALPVAGVGASAAITGGALVIV